MIKGKTAERQRRKAKGPTTFEVMAASYRRSIFFFVALAVFLLPKIILTALILNQKGESIEGRGARL